MSDHQIFLLCAVAGLILLAGALWAITVLVGVVLGLRELFRALRSHRRKHHSWTAPRPRRRPREPRLGFSLVTRDAVTTARWPTLVVRADCGGLSMRRRPVGRARVLDADDICGLFVERCPSFLGGRHRLYAVTRGDRHVPCSRPMRTTRAVRQLKAAFSVALRLERAGG